jgi:putative membrane protein
LILWGGINAYFANWIPVGVALLLAGGLLKTDGFDFAVERTIPGSER